MEKTETPTIHPPKEKNVISSARLLWPAPASKPADHDEKIAPKVRPRYFSRTRIIGSPASAEAASPSALEHAKTIRISNILSSLQLEAGETEDGGRQGDGGASLKETKVKYTQASNKHAATPQLHAKESGGEAEGTNSAASGGMTSAASEAAAAMAAESNENIRVEASAERRCNPPKESGSGSWKGTRTLFSIFGDKAAIKAGNPIRIGGFVGPSARSPPPPLLPFGTASAIAARQPRQRDTDSTAMNIGESPNMDVKPGAMAISPGGTTPNQIDHDEDDASRGGDEGSPNIYGVDFMAEARLVKDQDSDEESDSRIDREIMVRRDRSGMPFDLAAVQALDGTSVPFATAKRLPPLVQFVHNHCLLVAAACLLAVGGIAGLSAYLATRGRVPVVPTNPIGGKVSPFTLSTAHPTVSAEPTTSAAPTLIPTAMLTSAPTIPCGLVPEERASAVADFAAGLIQDSSVLENASSAQSRALAWLAREDAIDPPLCPGTDDSRLSQRFGLALLHFSLGGDAAGGVEGAAATRWGAGWSYKSSEDRFLDAMNECDWAGVGCNSDTRRVRRIELAGRNMRGPLPAEVFTVFEDLNDRCLFSAYVKQPHSFGTRLLDICKTVLDLQNNRIRGCLPENIGAATKLEFLYLSANELACNLPSGLANIGGIQELELFNNFFSGTIPANMLMGFGKLRRLVLSKNSFSGVIPPQIANLKTLETLHLNENKFNSSLPKELFELSNLVSLRLNDNSFDSTLPSSVSQLSRLEELYLHDNDLSGRAFKHLTKLSNLRSLALSHNNFSGTLPEELGRLINIEVLRLDNNNRIKGTLPASVASLKKLEVLTIQSTNIVGDVSEEICNLKFGGSGGSGNLWKLSADCDGDKLSGCDRSSGICCSCCDCVYPEISIGKVENSGFGSSYEASTPSRDKKKKKTRRQGDGRKGTLPSSCYIYEKNKMDLSQPAMEDAKDGLQSANRSDEIIQKIIEFNVSEAAALLLPSSPQSMAASWIINDDKLQLDSSDLSLLERYVMAVLYFSTEGDGWAQCSAAEGSKCAVGDFSGKVPFLSGVSVCEWAGISCYNDIIESIRLEYNSLGGTVPAKELSGLCLDTLSFRGNAGISMDFQSNYTRGLFSGLFELDLSECAFRDQLHESLFLPQRVCLNDNHFNGTFPSTASYGGISSLRLQYNEISGNIPSELGLNGSFVELLLDNNRLVGTVPDILAGLKDLEVLTLQSNELTGTVPKALCDLTFDSGGNLQDLWADCGGFFEPEVDCDCCSQCFD